jgi:hypothetical protein
MVSNGFLAAAYLNDKNLSEVGRLPIFANGTDKLLGGSPFPHVSSLQPYKCGTPLGQLQPLLLRASGNDKAWRQLAVQLQTSKLLEESSGPMTPSTT